MQSVSATTQAALRDFVLEGIDFSSRQEFAASSFWSTLPEVGTEFWLDTGDIDTAASLWNPRFTCLTTNNTLLNKEVQKGIYDDLMGKAAALLQDVTDEQTRIREIAFVLNARHGLRLAQTFGGRVSVELHTDVANDVEATIAYGRRFYEICPEHFIIKVPLTPAGLLATRTLREDGIPVNFTLGFSARQNWMTTVVAWPSYLNVFLGRLNSYVSDSKLGDGSLVGEKVTIASQRIVTEAGLSSPQPTRQIAASMRSYDQVAALAGVDVHTMPTAVAEGFAKNWSGEFQNQIATDYVAGIDEGALQRFHLDRLWDVSDASLNTFILHLQQNPPQTPDDIVNAARSCGVGDLFPAWTADDLATIESDGKIPKHEKWADRIESGDVGLDALMTLSALLSFKTDQAALDDRIRSNI